MELNFELIFEMKCIDGESSKNDKNVTICLGIMFTLRVKVIKSQKWLILCILVAAKDQSQFDQNI